MKTINDLSFIGLMVVFVVSFSRCSTAQKLQKEAPLDIGDVYFQRWTGGVKGAGSGLNIFIPTEQSAVILDSVYFREKVAKLELTETDDSHLYIGRFKTAFNEPDTDLVLSSDQKEEYSNQLPKKKQELPFEISDTECIVSYRKGEKQYYFKISNIQEKEPLLYPSTPPNHN
ncbi:MAG: hypothetical protein GYB32_01565 [Algicola sp.]|nr:hypothetical protein [Algicola sp.]